MMLRSRMTRDTVYLKCRFAYKDGEVQGLDPQVPNELLTPGGAVTVYLKCRFAYKDGEVQGLDPQVPYELYP